MLNGGRRGHQLLSLLMELRVTVLLVLLLELLVLLLMMGLMVGLVVVVVVLKMMSNSGCRWRRWAYLLQFSGCHLERQALRVGRRRML